MKAKDKLIKLYLPFSIRIIAYSSIAYFTKITELVLTDLLFRFPYISWIIILSQMLLFELVTALVKYLYRPTFIEKDGSEKPGDKRKIILSKTDYNFRYGMEVYIYSLTVYYTILAVSAVLIIKYFSVWHAGSLLGRGILGFFASAANFSGFALLVSKVTPKEAVLFVKLFSFIGIVMGWLYVFYSFAFLELSLLNLF